MNDRNKKQGFFAPLIGEKTPAKTAGLTYTAAVCAFLIVSFFVLLLPVGAEERPEWYLYVNFLAAPAAFAAIVVWYFGYTKTTVKDFLKEQKCQPKYYLIAVLLQVGLLSLAEVNGLFLQFLEGFGYQDSGITLPSTQGFGLVGVIVAVGLIPAVMEELFFRGIFQREMKDFSLWAKVIICGGLFSLYHQNPAQTIYQFICGASFALVAAKSGSFFPTVLSHFMNNALIVVLYAFGISSFVGGMYAIILVFSGICLVGSLLWLIVFDKNETDKMRAKKGTYKEFFACAGAGIFVLGLSWLLTFAVGF